LSFILILILELQHTLLPSKCYESRSVPQLLILSLFFTFGLVVESIKEFGGVSDFLLVKMKGSINKEMAKKTKRRESLKSEPSGN
jgi:hypothetical protein